MALSEIRRIVSALLLASISLPASPLVAEQASTHVQHMNHLPAIAGDYFYLDSEEVGRGFHIFVKLPESYEENSSASYPVVYVLDGDSLFPVIAPSHLFMTIDEKVPEVIVVGIAYGSFDPAINNRGYDFSAPAKDAKDGQGGAPKFLAFLKNELLPNIDTRYRTRSGERVVFGQSRGGYMVLYAAFSSPGLFSGYIASNPAFDPGRELFFSTPRYTRKSKTRPRLVITSGSNDYAGLRSAALEWQAEWDSRTDPPWDYLFHTIKNGTHSAYSATSYRIGMRWYFRGKTSAEQVSASEEYN